jgi:hypothetical protein
MPVPKALLKASFAANLLAKNWDGFFFFSQ